jgi:hypothetical protein
MSKEVASPGELKHPLFVLPSSPQVPVPSHPPLKAAIVEAVRLAVLPPARPTAAAASTALAYDVVVVARGQDRGGGRF